jgi:hypothetical protein
MGAHDKQKLLRVYVKHMLAYHNRTNCGSHLGQDANISLGQTLQ